MLIMEYELCRVCLYAHIVLLVLLNITHTKQEAYKSPTVPNTDNDNIENSADDIQFGENATISEADQKYLDSENKTSLPEDDVNKVFFLEYGNYTTQIFHYINAQDLGKGRDIDYCYDDYIRCITSQTLPNPVCAWHNGVKIKGVIFRPSYCDVYFENCKIGWRHWRVIGYGQCVFRPGYDERAIGIRENLRRMNNWVSHYYRRSTIL